MLERGKFCSSAAVATALAVSGGNHPNPDSEATKLSSHLPNDRYVCNADNLYAVPRIDLHEIEWIEADSLEADVSRFVAGSSTATTTTTQNNPKRCYRTSTSSGYSSHSPPLSAGSYSCYASAVPGQSFIRGVLGEFKNSVYRQRQFCVHSCFKVCANQLFRFLFMYKSLSANSSIHNVNVTNVSRLMFQQLECSDGDSFKKSIIFSTTKNNWDYRMRGFAGDLDFTLDVSRAERLGRTIAKAKRKRQWCRTLTAFFGLVFFVLSVVIVSLTVTRGRKIFGSM